MSAGLAHEFKNAMAALHGYAQFLQSTDRDERGQAAAAGLLAGSAQPPEMSTAFLNFAAATAAALEDVSLDELINECARELGRLFEERRVELMIESASLRNLCASAVNPLATRLTAETQRTRRGRRGLKSRATRGCYAKRF